MTLNETDQIPMNEYDFANGTKTNATKTEPYREAGATTELSRLATTHQTSLGVYSTPLEPYPLRTSFLHVWWQMTATFHL